MGGGVAIDRVLNDPVTATIATPLSAATAETSTNATAGTATNATASAAADGSVVDVADLVASAKQGVVSITTQIVQRGPWGQVATGTGAGSGFIIDPSGVIVTNAHVVSGARSVTVTLNDGTEHQGTVVGADTNEDIAVVRIQASGLHTLPLGQSSSVRVGQTVVAIGNALALTGEPTATEGIVSALNRSIDTNNGEHLDHLVQTDAAINPGNSGGPLLTLDGRVIGINSAGASDAQNIGFAISIDSARTTIDQILDQRTS